MKVDQLARLLDGLLHGLEGLTAASLNKDLASFATVLQPFANASVTDFSSFLGQFGLEFQQTGKISAQGKIAVNARVSSPKPGSGEKINTAVKAVQNLFAEIDCGSVDDNRMEGVLKPIAKLSVPELQSVLLELKIAGNFKTRPKMIDEIRRVVRHQMESHSRSASSGRPAA